VIANNFKDVFGKDIFVREGKRLSEIGEDPDENEVLWRLVMRARICR